MLSTSSRRLLPTTLLLMLVAGGLLTPHAGAQEAERSITIYSSAQPGAIDPSMYRLGGGGGAYGRPSMPGYAMVREDRRVRLSQGRGELRITDVAALIDPTTVSFASLTDPTGTRVIDQAFQFDLVSQEKLLERFIDQPVTVNISRGDMAGVVRGTLLSAQGNVLVVRNEEGQIRTINGHHGIDLPSLPDGLITRPTLVWNTISQSGGEQTARITYQTGGVAWWADYNVVFTPGDNANEGTLDLGAWVSILNQSGASYERAKLKLVAGQVQRAQPQGRHDMMYARRAAAESVASAPSFEQKSFFEYHLYTLSEPTTIPDNSTKQIELFEPARGVPCEKVLVYAGQDDNWWWGNSPATQQDLGVESKSEVDVYLRFKNEDAQGLGIPLPAGRIRVSQLDSADDSLEFIGEDTLKHTPKNEQVLIRMGQAFDVVGERRQTNFRLDESRNRMEETIEIEVRNRKEEAVRVIVQERMMRWVNWEFVGPAPAHTKLDSKTVHFPVTIEPNGKASVKFTVRYSW